MAPSRAHNLTAVLLAALLAACSIESSPPVALDQVAGAEAPSTGGRGGACGPSTPSWWDATYLARRPLTVSYGGTLAAGYSVGLVWDSSADVSAGRMLAAGDDVRVVYWDGSTNRALHRHLMKMNTASTEAWFKTQAALTTSSGSYWLYFKNAAPGSPLAAWSDHMAGTSPVYLAADDFEGYALYSTLSSGTNWAGSTAYTIRADPKDASNKVARVTGPGGGAGAYLFAGSYAWTDIALRARFYDAKASATYMGFMLRAENASPFHFLYTGYSSPATQIQFWNCSLNAPTDTSLSGSQFSGAAWPTASNDGANWHDHLVSVRGTRVRHSIDGTEWFPGAPPATFNANTIPAAGRIGLLKGYDNSVTAYYDDVIVRAFVDPEPTVAAGADEVGCDPCQGVTCTALDQCHDVGVCNPSTGLCSNPPKADGTACDDGNACTRTDSCQAGACTGASPVVCTAADLCHAVGTCNTSTGVCSNPPKADGSSCDDANACTRTDSCQAGTCTGSDPVVCTAPDACYDAGACDPATGACGAAAPKAENAPCNDGDACTQTDQCKSGVCTGSNPVACAASDQCHAAGTCDPSTGLCSNPPKADGAGCDDGDACTRADTCQAGVCAGGTPVVCAASDPCHLDGTCDPITGACSKPMREDGTVCDDGNACTTGERCVAGSCVEGRTVTCTPTDDCQLGACDPDRGCSFVMLPDDTECADGRGRCQSGKCERKGPVSLDVGCGCAATGSPSGLVPLAALLLVCLTRRRAGVSSRAP